MRQLMLCALLLAACYRGEKSQVAATAGGNPKRGREAIVRYGCTACHNIPGVEGPRGMVGPPLDHMASRAVIAGKFQNTPQNLIQWLQNPQSTDPNNSMPNMGVTPDDARDMAAYLYTLK